MDLDLDCRALWSPLSVPAGTSKRATSRHLTRARKSPSSGCQPLDALPGDGATNRRTLSSGTPHPCRRIRGQLDDGWIFAERLSDPEQTRRALKVHIRMSSAKPAARASISPRTVDLVQPRGDMFALTAPPMLSRKVVPLVCVRNRVVRSSGPQFPREFATRHLGVVTIRQLAVPTNRDSQSRAFTGASSRKGTDRGLL